jgi:hypothetical protein
VLAGVHDGSTLPRQYVEIVNRNAQRILRGPVAPAPDAGEPDAHKACLHGGQAFFLTLGDHERLRDVGEHQGIDRERDVEMIPAAPWAAVALAVPASAVELDPGVGRRPVVTGMERKGTTRASPDTPRAGAPRSFDGATQRGLGLVRR